MDRNDQSIDADYVYSYLHIEGINERMKSRGVAQRNIHKQDVVSRSSNKCWIIRRHGAGNLSGPKCDSTVWYCSPRDTPRSVASQVLLMCSEQLRDNIVCRVLSPRLPSPATNVKALEAMYMRRLCPAISQWDMSIREFIDIYAWTIVTYFENISRYRCESLRQNN